MWNLGVIVGKFLPPHRGHKFLIDTAAEQCGELVVIVCERPTDFAPAIQRASWMSEVHPGVRFMAIDDRYDENDSRIWAENTIGWLGRRPDVVFTSEDYGETFAHYLGCEHVLVDRQRVTVPVSGTAIRNDPFAHWDFMEPPVRAHFARRVCVLGAESTGTTTLAAALAERYRTPWVAEYGREYSVIKLEKGETDWRSEEFVDIAVEQCRREDAAARRCNRLLLCDTNAFATVLWHRRYMGFHSVEVERIAAAGRCDLYILTGGEIPFVQDGLRDGEHIRHEMHEWFADALKAQAVPWILVRGPHEQRMAEAMRAVESLFAGSSWNPGA